MKKVTISFANDIYCCVLEDAQAERLIACACDGISRKSYLRLKNPDAVINLNNVTYIECKDLEEMTE